MEYEAKFVLIGYYAQKQKVGTRTDRARWCLDVFEKYDTDITAACAQAGFDPSDEARSIIAVLADMAPGGAPKTRAGQALQTYLEYRGF